ncbi:MAG: hypothetical protein HY791_31570 [Deltaproteobacteria bacterium]|nr:hypothetical protein [Deltaproteobacteria bacterium]
MKKLSFLSAVLMLGAACGGKELTSPTSMPIDTFAAGDVRITFVMSECSDSCSEYEASSCSAEVDGETVTFDISVPYDDRAGVDPATLSGCNLVCGPQVIAHCDVTLDAGHYMVEAGRFSGEIHVE